MCPDVQYIGVSVCGGESEVEDVTICEYGLPLCGGFRACVDVGPSCMF